MSDGVARAQGVFEALRVGDDVAFAGGSGRTDCDDLDRADAGEAARQPLHSVAQRLGLRRNDDDGGFARHGYRSRRGFKTTIGKSTKPWRPDTEIPFPSETADPATIGATRAER